MHTGEVLRIVFRAGGDRMLERTLPPELRRSIERSLRREEIQELRFRLGSAVKAAYPWGEAALAVNGRPVPVTDELLKELLDRATGFSPYALRLEESGLYLPLEDGCRMELPYPPRYDSTGREQR